MYFADSIDLKKALLILFFVFFFLSDSNNFNIFSNFNIESNNSFMKIRSLRLIFQAWDMFI